MLSIVTLDSKCRRALTSEIFGFYRREADRVIKKEKIASFHKSKTYLSQVLAHVYVQCLSSLFFFNLSFF